MNSSNSMAMASSPAARACQYVSLGLDGGHGEGRDAALLDGVGHVVAEAQATLQHLARGAAAAGKTDEDRGRPAPPWSARPATPGG